MQLIDMHCDTIWRLEKVETGYGGLEPHTETLYNNTGHLNISGMQKAGTLAQFFANFIYLESYDFDWENAYEGALSLIARAKREIHNASDDMQLLTSFEKLKHLCETQKIGAFLTIEEGGILNNRMERLHRLYDEGIRLMTLTWNYENCIGFPTSDEADLMSKGLKPFGFEVLEEMNRLGMIIDVSHLSDGGFWDAVAHSQKPIVASHSNARSICNARRNLTDEMLKALSENGGVSGVNFFPYFVKQMKTPQGNVFCTADDIASHVAHMIQVGGEDLPTVGTDFDGYDRGESEMNHVSEMELFYDALTRRGLTPRQVDKVCSGNAMRVIEANL